MKRLLLIFFYLTFLSCKEDHHKKGSVIRSPISDNLLSTNIDTVSLVDFKALSTFLTAHKSFNKRTVFFIDMKIPSERFRFFVLDVPNKKIVNKGLVAQGINTRPGVDGKLIFSNEINSYCSALGKYSVGEKYFGQYGTAFKLYGLDSSNSNAYQRNIVIHAYKAIPDAAQKRKICYSQGCPMVSPAFFNKLQEIIDASKKPILLDIIY